MTAHSPGQDAPAPVGRDRVVDLIVRGCRVEGSDSRLDIAVDGGRIAALGTGLRAEGRNEIAAEGRLASPAFIQPHLHLDKVGVAPLLGPNRSGTLAEAIRLLHRTKRSSTVEAVADRAGRVIRQAVLAGTTFIRSHVDVDTIGGLTPLAGVLAAARAHADICQVQLVAFPQEGLIRDPGADDLMRAAMQAGAEVVGGMPHWEASPADAAAHIRFCMRLARAHDADVDMHIDETDDPNSRTFEMLVDATEHHGWQRRVTAGHCCAMAAWESGYTSHMIARAAAQGVSVITNPATNLLLQGRDDPEPKRRGVPPVKELMRAGVRVGCGQDCVQDAFYPFGTADPLQVALILCHAAQLSTPDEISAALATIRADAASIVGYHDHGLSPGCAADLLLLDAESASEALRTQAPRRYVIHRGRIVAQTDMSQRLLRSSSVS